MEEKLDMQSPNWVNKNSQFIAERFPNCVTETAEGIKVDFELLKQELSNDIIEGNKERYRLEWPGKREAIVTANLPTTKTLRPVREDSVDFDNTENLYIEGDNLEVLKLLQESYLGKVKMIYIDPPYNTGKDFVYKDNFSKDAQEELEESGQKDEYNQRLVANPETAGRYHSDWLSMMYPRLKLARNLLKNDGVIFVSIDDHESHNLRRLLDEVFGETSFIADICVVNNLKGRNDKRYIATANERLFMYVKTEEYEECGLKLPEERLTEFNKEDEIGKYRELGLRKRGGADTRAQRPNMFYPIYINAENGEVSLTNDDLYNIEVYPRKSDNSDGCWRWGKDTAKLRAKSLKGRSVSNGAKWDVFEKDYLESNGEIRRIKPKSIFNGTSYSTDRATKEFRALIKEADFSSPKSVSMLTDIIEYAVPKDSNEIVLDFFSGSGSSAHATLKVNSENNGNRKFIMVQLPVLTDEVSKNYKNGFKTICEIGKERIRRAAKKIKEETGADIDYGFRVYKLDESNMQDVYYKPQEYNQTQLDAFADNVKPDRTSDDLLAQVMLDWGLPLSLKIEQATISGKKVFKVAGNSLYACFDTNIDEVFIKEIAKEEPMRIVFKDSGFKNDTAKVNVKQLLKQLSPETEMKVL